MLPGRFGRRSAAVLLCGSHGGGSEYASRILSGILPGMSVFFLTDIPGFYMLKMSKIIFSYP